MFDIGDVVCPAVEGMTLFGIWESGVVVNIEPFVIASFHTDNVRTDLREHDLKRAGSVAADRMLPYIAKWQKELAGDRWKKDTT